MEGAVPKSPHENDRSPRIALHVACLDNAHVQNPQTALLITVPEAEDAVRDLRRKHDFGAVLGIPAHVTVLFPFMPPHLIDERVTSELGRLLGSFEQFDLSFEEVRWFDGDVAFLFPEPADRIRNITMAVAQIWPAWQPYGGQFDDVVPHLTIGDQDQPALREAISGLEMNLPITTTVTGVDLFTGTMEPGSWAQTAAFPLG